MKQFHEHVFIRRKCGGGDQYIRGSAPASYMLVLISRGLHLLMMAGLWTVHIISPAFWDDYSAHFFVQAVENT